MAQDKFPSELRKSALKNRFFSESQTMTKCFSLAGHESVRAWIIYWCNIGPVVAKSSCLPLNATLLPVKRAQQKICLQNIDINHLLRGEFFCIKNSLLHEMKTSLSKEGKHEEEKKFFLHFTWEVSASVWQLWEDRLQIELPWSVEIDCWTIFLSLFSARNICTTPIRSSRSVSVFLPCRCIPDSMKTSPPV